MPDIFERVVEVVGYENVKMPVEKAANAKVSADSTTVSSGGAMRTELWLGPWVNKGGNSISGRWK